MKKKSLQLTIIFLFVLSTFNSSAQNIGVNATGIAPNLSAGLDVDFTNKGFLVPRIALTGVSDAATIASPATSLLIYNTNAGLPDGVGYYYNSGTPAAPVWIRFMTGGTPSNDWALLGNSGTNPATNFIGTTDAQDWVIKTNNTEKIRVQSGGNVGIGTTNPSQSLHTTGNIRTDGRTILFGTSQNLIGDNSSALYWSGAHSTITQMIFRDLQNTQYGRVYGSGNGANFGLLDGDGQWSYLAAKDNYTAFRINNLEKMRIQTDGDVGIGTTNPTFKLHVIGKIKSDGITETSDERLKENIATIDNALIKVLALRGVYFDWKTELDMDTTNQMGIIAQEMEKVIPEVVNTDEEGYKSIEYAKLVALLIEAIKEQESVIQTQKTKLTLQQAQLSNVQSDLGTLKAMINQLILKEENTVITNR